MFRRRAAALTRGRTVPPAAEHHDEDREILAKLRRSVLDQELTRRRDRQRGSGLDWSIIAATGALVVAFLVWGFASPEGLGAASQSALDWVMENTGWVFMALASLFVVFVLWIALSRFGRIPLGREGEKPEFRTTSWISMMFAAGMGIGLMFYGVAEPLFHYISPPPGGPEGQSADAVREAMATSLFHWTLYPWAMYAVVGLAIAYGTYRLGRRQLVSSVFTSLFGARVVEGIGGRIINMLAIFATLFGTAASLGLGALQIGNGLGSTGITGGTVPTAGLVVIVAVLTVCFVASAISGIKRGIQWLSNINMVLAVVLALVVFLVGPTLFILNLVPSAVGYFFADLPDMAARTEAVGGQDLREWMSSWTVFYWAWWVSWTPFVGMFIAKISRGRTVRQFIAGVLLVPSVVSLFWFGIFGGSAIRVQSDSVAAGEQSSSLAPLVDGEPTISFDGALFDLLAALPMPALAIGAVSVLAMVLVGIFFVTGADSASLVMGSLSSHGAEEPRRGLVIFWGLLTGAVAAVMLLAGGDQPAEALGGLQRITIVSALPFVVVMLLMCVALVKDLRQDPLALRQRLAGNVVEQAVRDAVDHHHGESFTLVTRHECPDRDCEGQACAEKAAAGTRAVDSDGTDGTHPHPTERSS